MDGKTDIQVAIIYLLIIGWIVQNILGFNSERRIAVEKGTSKIVFMLMQFCFIIYVVPFIGYLFYTQEIGRTILFPICIVLCYAPGIIVASSVCDNLDRGFDYQRKASEWIKYKLKIGWGGLILYSLVWIMHFWEYQKSL